MRLAGRSLGLLAYPAALIATGLPVLLTRFPPLLDYPNHLSRLWLLQGGIDDPRLARAYAVDWTGASTNILIDLIAVGTRGLVPIILLGPALLIAALLLPALGMMALARVVHGRLGWWPIVCIVFVWNRPFLFGFLNFELALGLALLAAAGDEALRRQGSRWLPAWRLACAIALLVAHAFGLFFYAVLVGGLAIGSRLPSGSSQWRRAARDGVAAVLPLLLVVALFWLFAAHPTDARTGPSTPTRWQSSWYVGNGAVLVNVLTSYRPKVDLAFALAALVPAIVAAVRRKLDIHAGPGLACLLLLVGSLAMPRYVLGSALIDLRLPAMFWLSLPIALSPRLAVSGAAMRGATALALLLVVGRAAWFGSIWRQRDRDYASLEQVIALIPPGARVLPLMHAPPEHDFQLPVGRMIGHQLTAWHLPALAVIQRHAFLPTLFASRGRHVLSVRAPYDRIAVAEGAIATVDKLGRPLSPAEAHEYGYVARWPCFDYVLVLDADLPNAGGSIIRSNQIVQVAQDGFALLFRIDHQGPARCKLLR